MNRISLMFIMIISAFAAGILSSQDFNISKEEPKNNTTVPNDIESVKKVHEIFMAGVKGARERYIKTLKTLVDVEQKKGSLEGVEELNPEIDAMGDAGAVDSKAAFNNTAAKKAQEAYRKEIESLRLKYVGDLQKVQAEEVRSGKIENAKKIRAYIENVQGETGAAVPNERNGAEDRVGEAYIKGAKVQIVPASDALVKQRKPISRFVEKASASSFYDDRYKPDFACDGKEETEWALKGNSGSIEIQLKKSVAIKSLFFSGRKGDDFIKKGKVIINSKYEYQFADFKGGNLLLISWAQPVMFIRSIRLESVEGSGNPGINESYYLEK